MSNLRVGRIGEQYAADFLIKHGYTILHRNYYSHWGEIDIIAKYKDKICFIEVKTRVGDRKGKPYEAVTERKVAKLLRAIQYYIKEKNVSGKRYSLEVISILLKTDKTTQSLNHYTDLPFGGKLAW